MSEQGLINNLTSWGDWEDINVQSEVDFIRLPEGTASPGQRKWRANLITNYAFTEGMLEGVSIGGGLQPIAVNYDGNPHAFRIKDPRQIFITTRFEF